MMTLMADFCVASIFEKLEKLDVVMLGVQAILTIMYWVVRGVIFVALVLLLPHL